MQLHKHSSTVISMLHGISNYIRNFNVKNSNFKFIFYLTCIRHYVVYYQVNKYLISLSFLDIM